MLYRASRLLTGNHWRAAWLAIMLVAPIDVGCTLARSLMVQTGPKTEKVAAEFNRLADKHVVVYVWAQPETLWDYPKVRLDLGALVSAYLEKNVENISVEDPVLVESYIEKSNDPDRGPVEVGRHFRADMIVYLAVYKLSMRDPGLSQFHRGRIGSSVAVYDLTQRDAQAQHAPLKSVEVAFPEKGPVGIATPNMRPEQVRQATYDVFAVEVGKKFHDYERPLD